MVQSVHVQSRVCVCVCANDHRHVIVPTCIQHKKTALHIHAAIGEEELRSCGGKSYSYLCGFPDGFLHLREISGIHIGGLNSQLGHNQPELPVSSYQQETG